MNSEKNKTAESLERFLRPATFFLLSAAIGLSLWLNTGTVRKESGAVILERMTHTRSELMFRILSLQAISTENLESKEEGDFVRKAIIDQLKRLDEDPSFRSAYTEVQKRIILEYLGEDIHNLNEEGLGTYRDAFHLLYAKGKLPSEKDPLLSMPASRLALLRYYRTADPGKYESTMAVAKREAANMQFFLTGMILTFGGSTLLGIFLISRFFLRRPPPFFARFLESVTADKRSALLESTILYLFLMFPVGMVLARFVPAQMHFEFEVLHTIVSGALALLYFRSEAGFRTLLHTVWIPVIIGPAPETGGQTTGGQMEEGTPAPIDPAGKGLQVILGQSGSSILREILFGIGGGVVFLPLLMLKSAAGVMLGEGPFEFRFANPAVLSGEPRFWALFVFAVVVVPFIEEMVFRNWLYGALRFRFSVLFSALLTGIFCAALQPPGWWPFLLIPGAGLALLREFRPGLLAPIVAHSLLNAFSVLAGLGLSRL